MIACSYSEPAVRLRGVASSRAPLVAATAASLVAHLVVATVLSGGGKPSWIRPAMPRFEVTIVHKRLLEPAETANSLYPHRTEALEVATSKVAPAMPEKPREQALRTLSEEAGLSAQEVPDLTYYATRQLDVYPTLPAALELRYADSAAAAGITGHALILVLIDAAGTVNDVTVAEADPAGYFENDLRQAFMAARFTPAVRNGRPVRSRLLVRVSYGGDPGAR